MNKNTGDAPERATLFAPPDISRLVDRSAELRNRTRVVFEDMRRTSIRLHETLNHSEKLMDEAWRLTKKEDRSDI